MTIVVTAASGHLGRLVVDELLARGVPAAEVVATARSLERLHDLADRGVGVRRLDYDDPATFAPAFEGAERVLLVSGTDMGERARQHTRVAVAAQQAGVSLLAYTSILRADTTPLRLADEHRETEQAVRALGVPFTFLRNGWYHENYTGQIPTYLEHGAVLGSAGAGRISGAARADYAAAAAAVLTTPGHEGAAYELGGDEPFTLADLAATVAEVSGKPVEYRDLPPAEHVTALERAGLPAPAAELFADVDAGIARGALLVETGDLRRLAGRPATPLRASVEAALA